MIRVMAGESIPKLVGLGWQVPRSAKERFVAFCVDVGDRYQASCAGAMAAWEFLSPTVREIAVKKAQGLCTAEDLKQAMRAEKLAAATAEGALADAQELQRKTAGKPQSAKRVK